MRVIVGAALAAVLVAVASAGARAPDDEPKFDKKKLIGKWEPTDSKKGARAVMEFKKGGKLQVTVMVDDNDLKLDGSWEMTDDKLEVTLELAGKEETTTFKLKKLDDKILEYVEPKGKTITLKRLKN
ncbi:MAG TPA: TIGR03066 family protein [Gemmataceae bacterium]|nr:TIGR03066 family protein [Gemmataceae bacterium]